MRKLPISVIDKQIMMVNFSDLNTVCLDKDTLKEYSDEKESQKYYLGYYYDEYVIGLSSGTSGNKGLFITPKALSKRLPGVLWPGVVLVFVICRFGYWFACESFLKALMISMPHRLNCIILPP